MPDKMYPHLDRRLKQTENAIINRIQHSEDRMYKVFRGLDKENKYQWVAIALLAVFSVLFLTGC